IPALARRGRRTGAASIALLVAATAAGAAPHDAVDLGPCPADMPTGPLVAVLPLRDTDGLARLLAAQHDPASPDHHRWIAPAEFGARFGAPEADYEAAARWLEARGFRVHRWAGRAAIGLAGTAGQVARAFAMRL